MTPDSTLTPEDRTLLIRYYAGMCTECDQVEAKALLERHPSARLFANVFDRVVTHGGPTVDPVELDAVVAQWRESAERASALEAASQSLNSNSKRESNERLSVSEVAIGKQTFRPARQKEGVFSGQTLLHRAASSQILRIVAFAGVLAASVIAVVINRPENSRTTGITRTYATAAGQQSTLSLSDGSRVILAPQTTLRLVGFGAQMRTVELDGEAYFDIIHTGTVPFVVRSGGVTTRVLGTSFLVRHPAGSTHVHIAVETGKVRVMTSSRAQSDGTLTARQIGDVTDSTVHTSTLDGVPAGTEWMSGQLVFRHQPVATILRTLSRWYGYQFRYADYTLAQRNVTIGISMQSSAEALAEVERVLAVNLTVVGDTVTLVPQPAHHAHGSSRIRTYDVWTPTREAGR